MLVIVVLDSNLPHFINTGYGNGISWWSSFG